MKTDVIVLLVLACGCNLGPTVIGEYDSASGSGGGGGSGGSGDVATADGSGNPETTAGDGSTSAPPVNCPEEAPAPCEVCPDAVDGLGCAPGASCSNGVNRSCACQSGTWTCSDAPLGDACGPSCTMLEGCKKAGCSDRLKIALDIGPFQGDYGEVETGRYTIEIVADGVPTTCEFIIEYDAFLLGYTWAPRGCERAGGGESTANVFHQDGAAVLYLEPAIEIGIVASLEGDELLASTYTPAYEVLYPNAVGCEPGCLIAETTLEP